MSASAREELLGYAQDAIRILQQSVKFYREGQSFFYRVAAVELRLLLCDTTRSHEQIVSLALVRRLWPDLRLPALGDSRLERSLRLDDWLEQKLPDGDLTIRQFIRRVCDQDGGAHVDLRSHARLPERFPRGEWICRLSEAALAVLIPFLSDENSKS